MTQLHSYRNRVHPKAWEDSYGRPGHSGRPSLLNSMHLETRCTWRPGHAGRPSLLNSMHLETRCTWRP